jgi:hypothetical protein
MKAADVAAFTFGSPCQGCGAVAAGVAVRAGGACYSEQASLGSALGWASLSRSAWHAPSTLPWRGVGEPLRVMLGKKRPQELKWTLCFDCNAPLRSH